MPGKNGIGVPSTGTRFQGSNRGNTGNANRYVGGGRGSMLRPPATSVQAPTQQSYQPAVATNNSGRNHIQNSQGSNKYLVISCSTRLMLVGGSFF